MKFESFTFRARTIADTDRLGAALAACLPEGAVVSLQGTLGAGKTRLVQAIAAGCGISRGEVVSPTFVLCRHYEGARNLNHLDTYRLHDEDEFLELGVEELFASPAITLIEWGDRVAACLPDQRLEITIDIAGNTSRSFTITPHGERFSEMLAGLRERLGG